MMAVIGGMTPRVYTSQLYQDNQLQADKGGSTDAGSSTDVTSFSQVALNMANRQSAGAEQDSTQSAEISATTAATGSVSMPETPVSGTVEPPQVTAPQQVASTSQSSQPPPGYKGIDFMA